MPLVDGDLRITKILGIDNTSDPSQLRPKQGGIYLVECDNIDIDDDRMMHRKDGYRSAVYTGSNIHSFWSNGKMALFCEGTNFKKLNTDHTATTLIDDINPNDRMSYVWVGDQIFFSSMSIIGYVYTRDGLPYPFPTPSTDWVFKETMIGGQIIEYYNNRLYAANGRILFFSDATSPMQMDKRKKAVPFPEHISMVKAVIDGLYVSTRNGNGNGMVYFLSGASPFDFNFSKISDSPAIEGTAITVEDDSIGRGATGQTVYWMTEDGPYKGYPGGAVRQLQQGLFSMENLDRGTAILHQDGYRQFIAVCPLKAGVGGASGEIRIPPLTI